MPELGEDAVDDRRRGLGRTGAGQLSFGGERDARDPCAAVTGRLADEQESRAYALAEIALEAVAPARRTCSVPVEVHGLPDPGGDEPVNERAHRTPHSDGRRPAAGGDRAGDLGVHRRRDAVTRARAVRLQPRGRDCDDCRRRDSQGRCPRRPDPVRLQRRSCEPDPGASSAGAGCRADRVAAGRVEGDRRGSRPDAPQVRDPRRPHGLDRLAQLD